MKRLINKENEKPDPGFNSDLIPNFLDSGFAGGGPFFCQIVLHQKKGVGVEIKSKTWRRTGMLCPRNGSDAPGLIPEPIHDKVCGEDEGPPKELGQCSDSTTKD